MRVRLLVACALAACALVAGCGSDIQGRPVTPSAQPTEPSFPRSRPPTSKSTAASPTTTRPTPTSPPAAQVLPPDDSGYVFIETKSGQTRCQLNRQEVDCEAQFTNTPMQDGIRANGVTVSADGSMRFVVGNLGDIPVQTIDYRTYRAVGWTIEATSDGTRFTNEATKHGMFVSIEKVEAF
ncbi:hypothetical protein A5662_23805 [Mycobacteriaceae bacterium 1482268.1]|nr:hypothetical protein A5662_23805 [Mycobacteriaceae bacterium 1482268.1]